MPRRLSYTVVLIALVACRGTPVAVDLPAAGAPIEASTPPAVAPVIPAPVVVVPPPIRGRIEVRVIAGGAPVAGAEVNLSDGSAPTSATTRTDAAGLAHFDDLEPGPYEVWARSEHQVSPVVRLVRDGTESPAAVELALAAGGGVRGKVTADGTLPAGSAVLLEPVDVDHATRVIALDATGGFAFDGVPRGRWRLATDVPGFFRAADDLLSIGAATVEVGVRLQRGGVVTGVVNDAGGAPVKHATLVLRDQGAGQRTRPVAAPTVRLRWVHPLAGPRQMPRFAMSHFGAARAGPRPAECGRGHCGVDLGGKKGTPVHAAADGEVTVVVREIRKESGRFVVIEHAGGIRTHYLHLDEIRDDLEVGMKVRAGDPIGTVGRTGVIKSGAHLHFAMSQERGGRTYYVDAEPMLRHAVVLAEPRGLDWIGPELGAPTAVATAGAVDPGPRFTTDARGEFRLEGISPGEYVVAAFQASFAPGVSAPLDVRSGQVTGGVTIRLSPGVVLHGRVLARGIPVAGARVIAEEGLGESSHRVATTYTDARGEYELRSVAGKVVLAASATGFGAAERAIDLGPGGASREKRREDFDLVIEDGKLFGEVRDADGHGLAGVTVRVVDGPTARRRTTTDARGAFLLSHVAPGDYVVELASTDFPATRVELSSDRSRLITLEPGGSVRVDLRDAHTGDGLPQIQLDVAGPGDRVLRPRTDAAGIALVRGLTPGRWTFRARAAGYTTASRTLDVEAGRTPQPLRLDLARGAIVAGIIRDHYGRRVSGARVWIGDAETRTDNDGNFRIADAPTGAIDLHAALGSATGTLPLDLRPGDELVTLTLDLSE